MAPKITDKKRKASIVAAEAESDDEGSLNGLLEGVLSDEEDDDDFEDDASSESDDKEDDEDEDESGDENEDELDSDEVPSEGDDDEADESDELAKLTLSNGTGAEDEQEDEDEDEEDKPNYRVTTDANGGVRYIYDEIDPVYDSDDSAQEVTNTIGNIPLSFYDSYPHIGYDINGKKIMRPATGEALDALLDSIEIPKGFTGLTDPATGKPLQLSRDELELLKRVQLNEMPEDGYDPYPDMVEWFTSKEEVMPLSAAPEPKRRFLPSKHEAVRIAKLARAIREGRILPYKPAEEVEKEEAEKEEQHFDLWQDEQPREPNAMHIPAPKLPPPGHAESYNCPPEYVPSAAERRAWEETDPEDREQKFLPAKYDALRKVPGYAEFVKERFERCLDLYLAPRVRRNKLNIDPNSLLPKLPPAEELKPFPTVCQTIFRGHRGWVRTVAIDPTGFWLASGGSDGTVRLWELETGRQVWSVMLGNISGGDETEAVNTLAWRPTANSSSTSENPFVLAAAAGEDLFMMVPTVVVDPEREEASRAVIDAGFGYAGQSQGSDSTGKKPAAKWTRPHDDRLQRAGVLLQIRVSAPIKTINWHRRGDHFCTVAPTGGRSAVAVHTLSRHISQVPFRRVRNIPQTAQFHPLRPLFFLATKQTVRVYDLAKMQLVKSVRPGARLISSMDVHPGTGDHLVVGSYDRRLVWHDLQMASTPLRTMRYHERAVRAVAFHRGGLPLLADTSDDGTLQIYFGRVYSDIMETPTIVPLKKLDRGAHKVVDSVGALAVSWHPREAYCVSGGADGTSRLWM